MGEDSGSSVTVAVRLRPMNNREKALGTSCCVQMRDNQTILTNIQGHVAHKTDKVKKLSYKNKALHIFEGTS